MSYKFVVPSIRGPKGGDTTPPVESYDLTQKVQAAISTGWFTFLGLTVLQWSILALIWLTYSFPPWQAWLATLVIALMIGIVVTCWFGFDWSKRAATRPWDVDDEEIKRRRNREDEELKIQQQLARSAKEQTTRGDDVDGNPLTLTDEQRLRMVAINMLERVYITGQPATRDAMCGDGVCMQFEWNLVNAGMKAIGLRDKKTWQPCNFQDAWMRWKEDVRLHTDTDGTRYLEVHKTDGRWHAVERVQ